MKKLLLFWMVAMLAATALAQPQPKAEVLIVGTFHMANPGRDLYNTKADDMLSATRQQEMAQVIAALKKFEPTKIAIEAEAGSERVARQYADYLEGKYALTANETNQLGYRVAKEMGHKTVYAVDEEGEFQYTRVQNWAKANGKGAEFEKLVEQAWGAPARAQNEYLHAHTLLQTLAYMNRDEAAASGVASYFVMLPYGEPGENAGAELIAGWYNRNIRIWANIRNLVESPNERVLVIYGAGHLGWLQQNAANDAAVRLRKLAEFIEP